MQPARRPRPADPSPRRPPRAPARRTSPRAPTPSGNNKAHPAPDDRYRLVVQAVKDYAIYLLDTRGRILSWNDGATLIKGYAPRDVLGKSFSRFYTREDRKRRLPESELKAAAAKGRIEAQGWRVRGDGARFWADEILTALRDGPGGALIGFSQITRDLTRQKAEQDALRRSEQQYRSVVEGVRDYAILTLSPDNRITSWNPAAQRIMGFTEAQAVGQSGSLIFTPEDRRKGEVERELGVAVRRGRAEDDRWHLRRDGSRFWASGIMSALRDANGQLLGFVKILRDLTQRKQTDDELRRLNAELQSLNETLEQRVAERTTDLLRYQRQLRSLTSELVRTEQRARARLAEQLHDHLAQTLAVCKMKLAAVRKVIAPGAAGSDAADQLQDLLQQALAHARMVISDLRPAVLGEGDLASAVEWLADRMRDQHALNVMVRDDRRPKPLDDEVLVAVFEAVRELLLNIVKHAGAERATVSLSRLEGSPPTVQVDVLDRGSGFDLQGRQLVPTLEGGFGLFNIRERIDLLGGRVEVASSPGKGTRVTLVAPLSPPGSAVAAHPDRGEQPRQEPVPPASVAPRPSQRTRRTPVARDAISA